MSEDITLYEIDTNDSGSKTWLAVPSSYKITLGPGVPGTKGGAQWMLRVYEDAAKKNCVTAIAASGYRRADIAVLRVGNKDNVIRGYFARLEGGAEAADMINGSIASETQKAAEVFAKAMAIGPEFVKGPFEI